MINEMPVKQSITRTKISTSTLVAYSLRCAEKLEGFSGMKKSDGGIPISGQSVPSKLVGHSNPMSRVDDFSDSNWNRERALEPE